MLREVKGQHERFRSHVLDFHAAAGKCGLSDESDLGIDLTKNHVLVISHFEFSNTTTSTIGVEQCGTLGAENCLTARLHGEPENRALLIAKEITVNDPLCVDAFACEFLRR